MKKISKTNCLHLILFFIPDFFSKIIISNSHLSIILQLDLYFLVNCCFIALDRIFRGYTKWKGVCYDFSFRLVIQATTLLFSFNYALNVLISQFLRMNSQDSLFSSSSSVKTEAFSSPSLTEQKQQVSLFYTVVLS